jgi:AraC-like DNA-binding protein
MIGAQNYVEELGRSWHADIAPVVISRVLRTANVVFGIARGKGTVAGLSDRLPLNNGLLVGMQLDGCHHHEYWEGNHQVVAGAMQKGDVVIYDLTREFCVHTGPSLHTVQIHLSGAALDALSEAMLAPRTGTFGFTPGLVVRDPIVCNLATSILSALTLPGNAGRKFIDYTLLALAAHLARTYGDLAYMPDYKGGLAPWQERRAKELLANDLASQKSLQIVANECHLSISHFARAFRKSVGTAPHKWLLRQRVSAAKDLMSQHDRKLSEVALCCGFADQSHFTRVFSREVGCSPGAWRRHLVSAR